MKKNLLFIASIILIVSLCACNLQKAGTPTVSNVDLVSTMVAQTFTAVTQSAQVTPVASPTLQQPTNTPQVTPSPTLSPQGLPTQGLTPTQAGTETLTGSETPVPKPGSITGKITGYPYGALPKLVIVAYLQETPYNYSYWITASGDTSFIMTSQYLIPGHYQVVAYDASHNNGGCPTIVEVKSDQTASCDITDWSGNYPAKPSGVPNP